MIMLFLLKSYLVVLIYATPFVNPGSALSIPTSRFLFVYYFSPRSFRTITFISTDSSFLAVALFIFRKRNMVTSSEHDLDDLGGIDGCCEGEPWQMDARIHLAIRRDRSVRVVRRSLIV